MHRSLKIFALMAICFVAGSLSLASAQAQNAAASPATTTPPATTAAPPPSGMPRDTVNESYRLGTGDKVKITVFGQTDLSGEFVVDDQGILQLPLIGQVKAAGLTIDDFQHAVTTKLADGYLRDPRVSVEVTNYRPFYIIGEVNKRANTLM